MILRKSFFQEVIYQRSLAVEMRKQGIPFEREMSMKIFYAGVRVGTRRVDFFCRKYNYGRTEGGN